VRLHAWNCIFSEANLGDWAEYDGAEMLYNARDSGMLEVNVPVGRIGRQKKGVVWWR
jgi:hypothetical protein